jgi:FSR family fosmidomycin resistance protein-like MFS transporter
LSAAAGNRPASRATLLALSLGHGCADLCSGALFALLPFLVVERHYSYAAAGVFALTASVAHALFQPLIGAQGDRREAHWLLPSALIVTGVGMGAVGVATSYP